jgi:hypothetical protein
MKIEPLLPPRVPFPFKALLGREDAFIGKKNLDGF